MNNIPHGTVRDQLEDLFGKYATVAAIKIIRGAGSSLLAFVKLEDAKHTRKIYEKLHKFEFRGSKLELSKVSVFGLCATSFANSFVSGSAACATRSSRPRGTAKVSPCSPDSLVSATTIGQLSTL